MSEMQSAALQTPSKQNPLDRTADFIPGTLSVGRLNGTDVYDFRHRAALIAQEREMMHLPDGEPTPGGPWTMEIMPTPICSIKCNFCSYIVANEQQIEVYQELRKRKEASHIGLSPEIVFSLLDTLKNGGNTRGTYWSGGGEPLTWPHITDALIRASEFSKVFLQTNGTELDKLVHNPDALASVNLMSISTFAHTEALFRAIAGRDRFDRTNEHIKQILKLRETRGLDLTINAKVLVTPDNYRFVPEIVQLYRDLIGVDTIALRETQDYNYGSDEKRAQSVELTELERAELLDILSQHPHDNDLQAFAASVANHGAQYRFTPTDLCYNASHSHFAAVDPLGDVYLGNPEIGDPKMSIGNLKSSTWDSIWAGQQHREVIGRMNLLQCNSMCGHGDCRHVKANQGAQAYANGTIQLVDISQVMSNFGAFM